jgi:hypothetical protein
VLCAGNPKVWSSVQTTRQLGDGLVDQLFGTADADLLAQK